MSKTCERCNGSGIIKRVEHDVFGNNLVQVPCPDCNGTGKIEEDTYPYKELYTVKVYSNAGYIISTWDNVINTALNSDRITYLKLDNGKSVTVVGGIVIIEEVCEGDV